ncbi:phage terminase large subunit family protein, partial [Pseudomonas sp. 39004]|uniref:alpha/beta fold hydrolase n=1 Tax=Pseudomonas sp. 39004 TaxID=2967213 RepID=UPI002369142F|nr:phage terminase large subunit family protein [Pseudomonas sp. 39004]
MRTRTLLAAIGTAFTLISAPASATQPAAQASATLSKDRISVTVEGAGPDVILIPGLASSREVWQDLAARLKHSYRLHQVQ